MADCGSIMTRVQALQVRIRDDKDQLNDPNLCATIPSKQECNDLRERLLDDEQAAEDELAQVLPQVTPICSLLVGTWQVDANGSDGQLTIDAVDSVTGQGLSGSMLLAGETPDSIVGSWDDAAAIITFRRGPGNPVFQDYTGFLGNNNAIILAGWFTENDVPSGAPRSRFGWYARK